MYSQTGEGGSLDFAVLGNDTWRIDTTGNLLSIYGGNIGNNSYTNTAPPQIFAGTGFFSPWIEMRTDDNAVVGTTNGIIRLSAMTAGVQGYVASTNNTNWTLTAPQAFGIVVTDDSGYGVFSVGKHYNVNSETTALWIGQPGATSTGAVKVALLYAYDNVADIGMSTNYRPRNIYAATSVVAPSLNTSSGALTLGTGGTTQWTVNTTGVLQNNVAASESTGTTTVILGTNSPASVGGSPYTWLELKTSNGTTVYVPVWQ
jgi:hypothetical protein